MSDELLGPYRLMESLTSGPGGHAHLAWDTQMNGRAVVRKLIRLDELAAQDPAAVAEGLKRTAKAFGALGHPSLLSPVKFAPADSPTRWDVSEYSAGMPLGEFLGLMGRAHWRQAAMILHEVSGAMSAAHQKGLPHGALHTNAVLLEKTGRVTLRGFDVVARTALTLPEPPEAATLFDAPTCVAPEVLAGATPTRSADLYALGAVAYELVCGERPFPEVADVLAYGRGVGKTPDPHEAVADVPGQLRDLVVDLLAADAAKRPATIGEVRERLRRMLQRTGISDIRAALKREFERQRALFQGTALETQDGAGVVAADAAVTSSSGTESVAAKAVAAGKAKAAAKAAAKAKAKAKAARQAAKSDGTRPETKAAKGKASSKSKASSKPQADPSAKPKSSRKGPAAASVDLAAVAEEAAAVADAPAETVTSDGRSKEAQDAARLLNELERAAARRPKELSGDGAASRGATWLIAALSLTIFVLWWFVLREDTPKRAKVAEYDDTATESVDLDEAPPAPAARATRLEAVERLEDRAAAGDDRARVAELPPELESATALEKAKALLALGSWPLAARQARRGLEDPGEDEAELQWVLGQALVGMGDIDPAVEAFLAADEDGPRATRGHLEAGQVLARDQRCEQAMTVFQAAQKRGRRDALLHKLRGNCEVILQRYEDAVETLTVARELGGDDRDVLLPLGAALEKVGRSKEAGEVFLAAKRVMADAGEASSAGAKQAQLGALRAAAGDEGLAAALEEEVAQGGRQDDDAVTLETKGHAAFTGGKPAAALALFEKAKEALQAGGEPLPPRLLKNLAAAYDQTGDTAAAITAYEEAVNASNADAGMHRRLGELQRKAGQASAAARSLREAVRLAPEDSDARFMLGTLLLEGGDPKGAAAELRQVASRRPGDTDALQNLGKAQIELGDRGAALDTFSKLAKARPADPTPWKTQAALLQQLGRPDAQVAAALAEACRRGAADACE